MREALGDSAETPVFIETIPRRGYRFIAKADAATPVTPCRIRSLVVLPLENLSRDPEQEFFVDGLTEALITAATVSRDWTTARLWLRREIAKMGAA